MTVEEADEVAFAGEVLEVGNGRLAGERRRTGVASGGKLEEGIVAQGVAIVAVSVSGEDLEDALVDHFVDAVDGARSGIGDGTSEIPNVAAGEGSLHEKSQSGTGGELGLVEGDADFTSIRGLEEDGLMIKFPLSRFLVGFFHTALISNAAERRRLFFVNYSG